MMSVIQILYCCGGSFAIGAITALGFSYALKSKKRRTVKRLFPTLSIAREVYNVVSKKLDTDFQKFKLVSLKITNEKKVSAYSVTCTYEALGDEIFTF